MRQLGARGQVKVKDVRPVLIGGLLLNITYAVNNIVNGAETFLKKQNLQTFLRGTIAKPLKLSEEQSRT